MAEFVPPDLEIEDWEELEKLALKTPANLEELKKAYKWLLGKDYTGKDANALAMELLRKARAGKESAMKTPPWKKSASSSAPHGSGPTSNHGSHGSADMKKEASGLWGFLTKKRGEKK